MIGRAAAIFGIAALALIASAVLAATVFVMSPLPSRRGTVAVPHLAAPVDVRFDRTGVPHVRAVLEIDAWRALGFLHASDRMFQMELRRRAAAGRLAEVVGPAGIAVDREARISGYAALAARDWDLLAESERLALAAYADGVNAFLVEFTLPLEMQKLVPHPDPWTPLDSLAFTRLMQDDLSVAYPTERDAFDDARRRGVDAALLLLDAAENESTTVAQEIRDLLASSPRVAGGVPAAAEAAPAGSNAWAIAGTKTASGKPLLAGDPHLFRDRPGVWYAAHVQSADGLNAVGLTLAGSPGIIIGHNGRAAWSLTMHQADDSDLFVEHVDWDAGTYRRGDTWLPLNRTTETIHVKGATDVVVDVARTGHGPIIARLDDVPGHALSRAFAPAFRPQGPRAFLEAAHAHSGSELIAAWSHYAGPSVNGCWADVSGAIGVKVAGAIPRRRAGDGRFPVPGWTTVYDWDGTIPADQLPSIVEPKDGVVVTANDDWTASGIALPYPGYFAEPDRAHRARELALELKTGTVADMRAMQHDVYSPYAARVIAALRRLSFSDPRAAAAVSVLSAWDAKADRRGPARLFFAFMKEVRNATNPAKAGVTWLMLDRMIEGTVAQSFWDDPDTAAVETREGRIEAALLRALTKVEQEGGKDASRWSWGKVHTLRYPHPFASALPDAVARRLVFGPVSLPGEWHTLDVAGFSLRGDRYDVTQIQSARLVVDLADPDASRLVLPLGQSGQLLDRHGHDQLRAWSTGHDFVLPFTANAVADATISTMRLVPAD